MNQLIKILQTLSKGDTELMSEVATEIKELLIQEECGTWQVKINSALRLALELDRVKKVNFENLPTQHETHKALLKSKTNPELVNRIFSVPGVEYRPTV